MKGAIPSRWEFTSAVFSKQCDLDTIYKLPVLLKTLMVSQEPNAKQPLFTHFSDLMGGRVELFECYFWTELLGSFPLSICFWELWVGRMQLHLGSAHGLPIGHSESWVLGEKVQQCSSYVLILILYEVPWPHWTLNPRDDIPWWNWLP